MKKLLILSIILLASCTSKTILEKPKDLIPKDTMVLLLTDLYIAKSAFNEKNLNNEIKINYHQHLYTKYKIDSTRYKRSNFYYTSNLEKYDQIFKRVKNNLSYKLDELLKKVRTPKNLKDIDQFHNQ